MPAQSSPDVYVYIDGFNFYYRLFKNSRRPAPLTGCKWLNLYDLACRLVPGDTVVKVQYFTAYVKPAPWDRDQQKRQHAYLGALRTIPQIEIVPGNFRNVVKMGILRSAPTSRPVQFNTREEKGSDVNLAARLVWDAAVGRFDKAVVISNDADLAEAIRIVTQELKKPVHLVSPDLNTNAALRRVATTYDILDTTVLPACLLPDPVVTAGKTTIHKPASW